MVAVAKTDHIIERHGRDRAQRWCPGKDLGPVISAAAKERIERYIAEAEDARGEGARRRTRRTTVPGRESGYYVGPDDHRPRHAGHAHRAGRGLRPGAGDRPRAATSTRRSPSRTRSPYGNAASVFTESGGVARYVMEHASAGMVGVNVGVPVPREPFWFGGWNESKFGVGDITGRGSIEFWTQVEEDDDEVEQGGGRELDVAECTWSGSQESHMAVNRSVDFTGIHFENPFLLSSAPPTESESNILRAFEAGWAGVVTKTIGLHPVVNVVRRQGEVLAHVARGHLRLDEEAPGRRAPLLVELGAHLRQVPRLVAAPHPADQGGLPRPRPDRVDHGGLRERQGAEELAAPRAGLSGRRGGRARAQLLVPPHGPQRHGVEHREGRGTLLGGDRGGEGSREGAGLVQAHAGDARTSRSRRRPASAAAPTRSSPPTPSRPFP